MSLAIEGRFLVAGGIVAEAIGGSILEDEVYALAALDVECGAGG